MKCRSIACLAVSAVVGFALTAWFLHDGGPLPEVVPPENVPAPGREDEAARLERMRLERREALRRTAGAFVAEAVTTVSRILGEGDRVTMLASAAKVQAGEGDFAAARATAAAIGVYSRPEIGFRVMNSSYDAIAMLQTEAGDFAGAVATATAIEDRKHRAELLHRILRLQLDTGGRAALRQTLHAWLDVLQIHGNGAREKPLLWLQKVADVQAEAGDREGAAATLGKAFASARAITHERMRHEALVDLAKAQAGVGDVDGVTATLAAVKSGRYSNSNRNLAIMAKAQAEAGDIAGARAVAEAAPLPFRGRIWSDIVEAQARAGDSAGALATATAHRSGAALTPDTARKATARVQYKAGDFAAAGQTAATMMDWAEQDAVRSEIAHAQSKAGDFAGAMGTAAMIRSVERRDKVYESFAATQRKAEAFADAREAAVAIEDERKRALCCLTVARTQIAAGDRDGLGPLMEAVTPLVAEMEAGFSYVFELHIARLRAAVGDVPGAMKLMRAAAVRMAAKECKRPPNREPTAAEIRTFENRREWERKNIYEVQVEIGDFAGAVATFALGENRPHPNFLYAKIAGRQARMGDMEAAWASVERIGDIDVIRTAYLRIAVTLAEAGDSVAAIAVVEKVDEPAMRMHVRARVATALAKAGDLNNARAEVAKGVDSAYRVRIDKLIARTYGERGDAAAVFELARQELDARCRAHILLGGASGLFTAARSDAAPFATPSTVPLPPTATRPMPIPVQPPAVVLPPNHFPPPPPLPE